MSDSNRNVWRTGPVAPAADMSVDAGLRSFMLGVYNKLGLGLILSGVLAWATAQPAVAPYLYQLTPDGRLAGFTILGMVLRFAPLAVILGGMFFMKNATPRTSGIYYWSVVSLIGAGLGIWLITYTGQSVAQVFFITAAAFGGLSLFGYTTKRNLTAMGSFMIMGMIGLFVAMIVNMFLHSSAIAFLVSVLGVLIFSGLIAYDTQRLKMNYYEMGGDQAAMGVATNYGALSLYLDFINLFQFLLSIFGNRR